MEQPIQFHWSPWWSAGAQVREIFAGFCDQAELAGIESVGVPGSGAEALRLAGEALTGTSLSRTSTLAFRISCCGDDLRIPEFAEGLGNATRRIIVHVGVSGEDAGVALLRRVAGSTVPLHIEGDSAGAAFTAIKHGDCLFRLPDFPERVRGDVLPIRHFGKQAGLVTYLMARPGAEAATDVALTQLSDLPSCRTELESGAFLWTGSLPERQQCAILVGSFDGIASAILEYKSKGITQFLVRAAQDVRELCEFSDCILPRVRALEAGGHL
jgi:hypothetical protein